MNNKIKRLKIKGFRGILEEQDLDLSEQSIVIFGRNSYGKSSFVDSLEWLLSAENKIESLGREGAKEKAYPHLAIGEEEAYVEVEFSDPTIQTVRKSFSPLRPTIPTLSDSKKLNELYNNFVIQPHLRYSEIAKFVLYTKAEKYRILAKWMGFEYLYNYQLKLEKIASELKLRLADTKARIKVINDEIEEIIGQPGNVKDILSYCNEIINRNGFRAVDNREELKVVIDSFAKQSNPEAYQKATNLIKTKTTLLGKGLDPNLIAEIRDLTNDIETFNKKREGKNELAQLDLCEKGLSLIVNDDVEFCPLCDLPWAKKDELLQHVKEKISAFSELKKERNSLIENTQTKVLLIESEITKIDEIILLCDSLESIEKEQPKTEEAETPNKITLFNENDLDDLKAFKLTLENLKKHFSNRVFLDKELPTINIEKLATDATDNLKRLVESIDAEAKKTSVSKDIQNQLTDLSILSRIHSLWARLEQAQKNFEFVEGQMQKFFDIKDATNKRITTFLTTRFDSISNKIRTYFQILRPDADIQNIKIDIVARERAQGRSAEIELDFYEKKVTPPYKILSESLLNSLGLAIYFACIKEFNTNCGFVILDDIINSLDSSHRQNVITLIAQEFGDYQLIVLTHDDYWFDSIKSRFQDWKKQKILKWEFDYGPRIAYCRTNKEEILDTASDPTKLKDAGNALGRHLECVLNILCENLRAKTDHRYSTGSQYTLSELLDSFISRLNKKLSNTDKGYHISEKVKDEKNDFLNVRNFCSHYKDTAASIAEEEIKSATEDWFEIETSLLCTECKQYVMYDKQSGYEHIACPCRNLILK